MPSIGRFASADVIVPDPTNPQSFNRYSYVRNRVLNFTDPTGHRECGAFEGCSGEALPDIQKPALPTHSNHEPIPRNEYSEVELIFITLGVFAESSMGQHSPQAQSMKSWVWFNRVSPGKVFSNIDSSNPAGCPDNCAAWAGIVNDFLPNDITYAQASPEQRRIALINAYSCYMSSGCSKWGTNFNSTKALVDLAYTNYINGALDPTDGSTQFSHQSNLWRNNRLLANGSELYDYLVQNFYSYSQKNPDFRYSISKPFPFPFPGGEQKVILVTGNHNCVHFGSCK